MKPIQLLVAALCLSSPLASFAQGHSGVGGGDQCKNEINKHRLQIKGWIERDEAKDLDFTKSEIKGQNYTGYKQAMLNVLQDGRVVVNCYLDPARISDPNAQKIAQEEGVSYRSVKVNGGSSTCINYEDKAGISHIDCNYDLVMNANSLGNPNYINTHHEFASIAGVEKRASNPSDFSVSNQLSQFERVMSIKVLGPKKEVPVGSGKPSASSDQDDPEVHFRYVGGVRPEFLTLGSKEINLNQACYGEGPVVCQGTFKRVGMADLYVNTLVNSREATLDLYFTDVSYKSGKRVVESFRLKEVKNPSKHWLNPENAMFEFRTELGEAANVDYDYLIDWDTPVAKGFKN